MTPERWLQIERLYHVALGRDASQRAAFLDGACGGDEALRQEVESLLAREQSAEGLLAAPAAATAKVIAGDGTPSLIGRQLGTYRVLSLLGAGGMGEVYRARDTKLGRDVALKVLPSMFANRDRLARFDREARLLATLNHPHIGAIYGFEESGGVSALVMELVEGDDLSQRVARGAIPLEEALPVARQIAEALEAAHEQGIIHRDLKPANIKVRADGTVKVLDFGLAKAMEPTRTMSANASMSPTIATAATTLPGMILGTAAYMSPEQACGKAVDKRADIWAFGAVLYEMLTGQCAFKRDNVSETLAAVIGGPLKDDALAVGTPPRLKRLLQRCLERDVRMRLRDIGEARVELVGLESGATREGTTTSSRAPRPARAARIAKFQLTPPRGADFPERSGGSIGISPDGRYIVFAASADGKQALWLRPIDATDARLLPGTEGGVGPFWSPDSTFVAFFAGGKLKKLEISSGGVQSLCEASGRPGGGAWSREGVIVFGPILEGPLFRVPARGGAATPVTTLDVTNQESNRMWPAFLPDGRRYMFQVLGLSNAGIYVGSLDSSERTLLIHQEALDLTAVHYAPSGHLVYVTNHTLVAQSFDARSLKLSGEAFPLAQGFGIGGPGIPAFGVSDNGVLVFRPEGEPPTFQPTWFGRDGTWQGAIGPPGPYGSFDLSADDQTLALDRLTEKEGSIWLVDVTRGTSTRFTSDALSMSPRWSPQGDRLVFQSVRDTPPNPFVRTLAGAEQRLARLPAAVNITSWAPDGRLLIGDIPGVKTRADLWLFSASGEKAPTPFIQTPFHERDAQVSPDGRWVAFASDEGGTPETYITTFPEAGRRVRVSTQGGVMPRWRDDGQELFFQQMDTLMAVSVETTAAAVGATGPIDLQFGLPRELFTLPAEAGFWIPAKGGQRFLVSVLVTKPVPAPIQVVINWNVQAAVKW